MEHAIYDYYREREEHTVQLAQDAMDLEDELDEEEEEHDPARVCWANLNGNEERCVVITGFTCDQVLELFEACEDAIPVTTGRGRRSRVSKHDRLVLVLCYIKHYETKEKLKEHGRPARLQPSPRGRARHLRALVRPPQDALPLHGQ
jgi:hypothetical protein